jgi:protease I
VTATEPPGRKIAVVVEHKFIPEEMEAYRSGFALRGYEVEFLSRLWYPGYQPQSNTFFSDVDPSDNRPWEGPSGLLVTTDISTVRPESYAAVLMAANYTSVRLRYADLDLAKLSDDELANFEPHAHVRKAPVVRFFADAMRNKNIVKGYLCHGLWILTPNPHLLQGRSVICHTVVMADIVNCDAQVKLTRHGVVTDDDVVTGFSKDERVPFIAAVADAIKRRTS